MVKKFYLLLFALVVLLGFGCQAHQAGQFMPPVNRVIAKHIQLGNQYYEKDRISDALREWDLALALDPGQLALAERITKVKQGERVDIKADLVNDQSLSRTAKTRVMEGLEQARQFYRESKLKEAAAAWKRVLLLDAHNRAAKNGLECIEDETYREDPERSFDALVKEHYTLAMVHYRQQNWEEAVRLFENAIQLCADQPQVNHYLKEARAAMAQADARRTTTQLLEDARKAEADKQWISAKQKWQALLAIEPDDAQGKKGLIRANQALAELARLSAKQGDEARKGQNYSMALQAYKKALYFQAENRKALDGLAALEQIQNAKKVKQDDRQKAANCFREGTEDFQRQEYKKAITAWEQAAALDPGNTDYRTWLARAREEAQKRAAKDCQIARTRYNDGLQAFQREALEQAVAAFQDVIDLCPDCAEAKKAAGYIQKIRQSLR